MKRICTCILILLIATFSMGCFMIAKSESDNEIFWCKVENNEYVTYRSGFGQYGDELTFKILRYGTNWYIKYRTGSAIALSGNDLRYEAKSPSLQGNWYVSSTAMQRALDSYNQIFNTSIADSEFVLLDDEGSPWKIGDFTFILKIDYQSSKTIKNDSGFRIIVYAEEQTLPLFWISLTNDEFHVESLTNGIKISVSQVVFERALNSYLELSMFK